MDNKISKIITLSNNKEYMIMDQGNYNNKSYYLVCEVDEEGNLLEKFNVLENSNDEVTNVTDEKLLKALLDYFQKRNNN